MIPGDKLLVIISYDLASAERWRDAMESCGSAMRIITVTEAECRPYLTPPARPVLALFDIPEYAQDYTPFLRSMLFARQRFSWLPMLAVTGLGDDEAQRRLLEAGADDILARPVTAMRLKLSVRNLLLLAQLRQRVEYLPAYSSAGQDAVRLLAQDGEMRPLDIIEQEAIAFGLHYYNGQITRLAHALGIGRTTLYRKLKQDQASAHEAPQISRANHTTRPMMRVSDTARS